METNYGPKDPTNATQLSNHTVIHFMGQAKPWGLKGTFRDNGPADEFQSNLWIKDCEALRLEYMYTYNQSAGWECLSQPEAPQVAQEAPQVAQEAPQVESLAYSPRGPQYGAPFLGISILLLMMGLGVTYWCRDKVEFHEDTSASVPAAT